MRLSHAFSSFLASRPGRCRCRGGGVGDGDGCNACLRTSLLTHIPVFSVAAVRLAQTRSPCGGVPTPFLHRPSPAPSQKVVHRSGAVLSQAAIRRRPRKKAKSAVCCAARAQRCTTLGPPKGGSLRSRAHARTEDLCRSVPCVGLEAVALRTPVNARLGGGVSQGLLAPQPPPHFPSSLLSATQRTCQRSRVRKKRERCCEE